MVKRSSWFFILFVVFILGCGMGRYHLVFDRSEPEIYFRETDEVCKRYASSFTESRVIDFYGPPCYVRVEREIKRQAK